MQDAPPKITPLIWLDREESGKDDDLSEQRLMSMKDAEEALIRPLGEGF